MENVAEELNMNADQDKFVKTIKLIVNGDKQTETKKGAE